MKHLIFAVPVTLGLLAHSPTARATPANHPMPVVEVVTTTRDSGRGSLRAAIESANRNAHTRIVFQISATDSGFSPSQQQWTIVPLAPLPALEKPDTQIEANDITLSGFYASAGGTGLTVHGVRCRITGMRWSNWSHEAIAIRASQTRIERNSFSNSSAGVVVQSATSRANRFTRNLFEGVTTPISLLDGANDGVAPPLLNITRHDAMSQVSHLFTMTFQGKPGAKVTLELNSSPNETRTGIEVKKTDSIGTFKADKTGKVAWEFNRRGYPVGSWTLLATQNNSTSAFSNVVIMPYL